MSLPVGGCSEAGRSFKPRAASHTGCNINMSAPGEDTCSSDEDGERMDEVECDEESEMAEDGGAEGEGEGESRVYVPGLQPLQPGEELEMDRSAYRMYHECQTGTLP